MAHIRSFITPLSRRAGNPLTIATCPEIPRLTGFAYQTIRCAATKTDKTPKKNKKKRNTFRQYDIKKAEQFSLIDAMQYA